MRRWMLRLLLSLAVMWITLHLTAGVAFIHCGIEQGLPEQKILAISQDSLGFIWFAGENHIYRYEGFRFTPFAGAVGGATEQPFGKILTLYTDTRGTLWAGTSSGAAYFNTSINQFSKLTQDWLNEDVYDFDEDNKGDIWLATSRGLAKVDNESLKTTWYTDFANVIISSDQVLPAQNITNVTCQDDGKIWFADCNNNLFVFEPESLTTINHTVLEGVRFNRAGINWLKFAHNKLFIATSTRGDRKSTRLNSSHVRISYAVFCL